MILGDLHIHSSFSDGKHTIPEIVDFYGKRGFGVIAITDHLCETNTLLGRAATYLNKTLTPATFPLYMEILKSEAERAWRLYQMVVIPGYEITKNSLSNHRSAHILGIGIESFVPAEGEIKDLCRQIQAQGALAIAAHPVPTRKIEKQTYHLWDHRDELSGVLDAWEVASGPFFFDEVRESGLPLLATSDLHHFGQINSWKTAFHCEKHPEAIMDAIRKQDLTFHFYQEENGNDLRNYLDLDLLRGLGAGDDVDDLRNLIVPKALK